MSISENDKIKEETRKMIINHLKLSKWVEKETKIFNIKKYLEDNEQKDIDANSYNSFIKELQTLSDCTKFTDFTDFTYKKAEIVEEKNEYLKSKDKFEKAIKDISSSQSNIYDAANQNKIDYKELSEEYKKFNKLGSSYQYDRNIKNGVFTYIEEFSLLEQLKFWKIIEVLENGKNKKTCSCRCCALEYLLKLAYTFAGTKEKCPSKWEDHKQADEQWLKEFEMRHSEEVSKFEIHCVNFPINLPSASQPSSPIDIINIINILESSTSSTHQTTVKHRSTSEPVKLQKIFDVHKKFDIRQRIKNFLELIKDLKPILEEVLMNDNLKTAVQKYNIKSLKSSRVLYGITIILKNMKKYLETVNKRYNRMHGVMSQMHIPKQQIANQFNIQIKAFFDQIDKNKQLTAQNKRYHDNIIPTLRYRIITYREEYNLLKKLQLWKEESQSPCSCQICALEHLHQLISDACFVKYMRNDLKHSDKIKKLNEEWLYEFEIRHSVTLSKFSSNCELDNEEKGLWMEALQKLLYLFHKEQILETSMPSIHLQGDRLQTSNVRIMNDIRQRIIDHLNLSSLLKEAVEEVIYNNKNVANVALNHGFNSKNRETFDKNIDILKKKIEYCSLKDNIEEAINDISVKKKNLTPSLAAKYAISYEKLIEERAKFLLFKLAYEYDEYVSNYEVPTFSDEFSLLEKLDVWKTTSQNCTCQACALEIVFCLAYIFANINKSDHQIWEYEMIYGNWICEFEIRHREEISKFSNYFDCKKENKFPASISYSMEKEKILKPSTLSTTHLQSHVDPKICEGRMQEQETLYDRFEIIKLLKLSKWIQTAAEEVVNKTEEVATVVRKYGFNSQVLPDLNKRIDILEKRRKYVELKDEIEKAIKTISPDNITEVAENYKIDKEKLEKEFKKYSDLEDKDKYIYDPFTSDDEIFTYKDEFSLLGMLKIWKQSRRSECNCCLCTLQHLRKLAYASTKRNKRVIAKHWSTHKKASINWLCEFVMIHSEEISKYLRSYIQYSSASSSASKPEEETLEPLQKVPRTH